MSKTSFFNRGSENVSFNKSLSAKLGIEAEKPVMLFLKGSYNAKFWSTADIPFNVIEHIQFYSTWI